MVVKNTQIRVAKTHYRAKMRWSISVRHADCQPEQQGCQAGGTAAVWRQEGQYLLPAMWLPEFISVISITPGNSNRDQNVEGKEEKQKRAWESILMRRKREVHITRAAGSQSTHGPLQHFPTGSKLSHPAWFPREITGTQSCSVRVCVCPMRFNPILDSGTVSKLWASRCVLQNQEDRDILGGTGLQWGYWARSP